MSKTKNFLRMRDLKKIVLLANQQVELLEKRASDGEGGNEVSEIVSRLRGHLDGIGRGVETLTGFWRDSSQGFVISDGVKIVDCNPAMGRFLGYEDEDALLTIKDFPARHGADLGRKSGVEEIEDDSGKGTVSEKSFRTKEGRIVWGLSSGSSASDSLYYGITVDITEKKKVELQLADVTAQLKRLEMADGLTKLPNRRLFDEHLDKEWRRAMRNDQSVSLILCGVDYFKRYNDTYGHLAGDDCLRTIAGIVGRSVNRPCDLAARYGGEEFGIILSETDEEEAAHIAKIICQGVESRKIPHERSGSSPCISVSIGIACMKPVPGQRSEEMIVRADAALCQSRETGRNRCVPG